MIKQIKIKTFKTNSRLEKINRMKYFFNVSYVVFQTGMEELVKINDTTDDIFKKTIICLGLNSKIGIEDIVFFNFLVKDEATEEETEAFFENFQMILDNGEDFSLELEASKKYEPKWGGGTVYTLSALGVSKEMNRRFQGLKEFS